MAAFTVITPAEWRAFEAAIASRGLAPVEFEVQEDVFDPAKAEVEAALGEVGVRRTSNEAVEVYRLGPGRDWVADFEADVRAGKFD
jgi:hypothetical protein